MWYPLDIPEDFSQPFTDYARWRLHGEEGAHIWDYLTSEADVEAWPQTTGDKYWLGLPVVRIVITLHSGTVQESRLMKPVFPGRTYLIFLLRKQPSTQLTMGILSINTSRRRMAIGRESMMARYS